MSPHRFQRMRKISRKYIRQSQTFLNVSLMTVFVAYFSGSEVWTYRNTPDSEFYLSLGSFGSEVTDRAPTPAYYWTRLTMLLPLRALNHFVNPISAFEIYRFFLLIIIVTAVYLLLKNLNNSNIVSGAGSLFVALNSTILYSVGDTYVTGTVISYSTLFLYLLSSCMIAPKKHFGRYICIGVVLTLLLFANPVSFVLGFLALLFSFLYLVNQMKSEILNVIGRMSLVILGAIGTYQLMIFGGALTFPKLNWFTTVKFYATTLKATDYASLNVGLWLPTRYSLLVIPIVISTLIFSVFQKQLRHYSKVALLVLVPTLCYFCYSTFVEGSSILEANIYTSFLWPYLLIALLLVIPKTLVIANTFYGIVFVALIVVFSVFLGSRSWPLSSLVALLICGTGVICGFFVTSFNSTLKLIPKFVLVTVLFSVFPILQNGEPFSKGLHLRRPPASAYNQTDTEMLAKRSIEIEQWVLNNTSESDKLFVWVNSSDGIYPAAMQLWGPNSLGQGLVLSQWELSSLSVVKPNKIVVYDTVSSSAREERNKLLSQIRKPGGVQVLEPICKLHKKFPPEIQTCLVSLLWESERPLSKIFTSKLLLSQVGNLESSEIVAVEAKHPPGFLSYGPYISIKAASYYSEITYSSDMDLSESAGYFEIYSDTTGTIFRRELPGTLGISKKIGGSVDIPLGVGSRWEFRTFWYGAGKMIFKQVAVYPN
jgi:hypothetical protein